MENIYVPKAEFPREQRTSVAEHEILMAFTNDSDTEYFEQWWEEEGNLKYAEFTKRKLEEAAAFDD